MSIRSYAIATAATVAAMIAVGSAHATTVTTSTSQAAFIALNSANAQALADQVNWGLFDDSLHQPHENGSIPTGSMMTTTLNEAVKASASDHNAFVTYVEGGPNWKGDFASGMTILATSANSVTLSFGTPLIGLGLHAQILDPGVYTETVTAYSSLCTDPTGATCTDAAHGLLGHVTNTGTSTGAGATGHEGSAPFAGISTNAANTTASLAASGISFVVISNTGSNGDGFAIDTSLIYHYAIAPVGPPPPAPEPATLGLLGVGLLGLGLARRRSRA